MKTKRLSPHLQQPNTFPILRQMIPIHVLPFYFSMIHFNMLPSMSMPSRRYFCCQVSHLNPVSTHLTSIHTTCHAHLVLLDLITRVTFGKGYKSWSSLLCNCFQSHVISFLLAPISPSAPYSRNYCLCLFSCFRQSGKQKILHRKISGIPRVQSALIYSWITFLFFRFVPTYLKFSSILTF